MSKKQKDILEQDLDDYFKRSTLISNSSKIEVFVTIKEAKIFAARRTPGAAFIPIIGLFVTDETKMISENKILIEVTSNGKTLKTMLYDKTLERVTPVGIGEMDEHYQAIMREMKDDLYTQIESQVFPAIM
jgi:hypothetical protein